MHLFLIVFLNEENKEVMPCGTRKRQMAAWITAFSTAPSSGEHWDPLRDGISSLFVTRRSPGRGGRPEEQALSVAEPLHTVPLTLREVARHLQEMITGCVLAWEVTVRRWQCYSTWENCTAGKAWLCRGADWRDRSLASARDAWSWFRRLCFLGQAYSESSMSVSV